MYIKFVVVTPATKKSALKSKEITTCLVCQRIHAEGKNAFDFAKREQLHFSTDI